jgi:acetyl-CoA carboxylase carboxyltransferase component
MSAQAPAGGGAEREQAGAGTAAGDERELSIVDAQPRPTLRSLVEDLEERRAKVRAGGGPEKVAKQHERGKLTARERLDLLIDAGTFVELGMHGAPTSRSGRWRASKLRPTG